MTRGDLTDNQWERLEPHLPPTKAPKGPPQRRSSAYHKRHPVDRSHRSTLARFAREVWALEDCCKPFLPLGGRRGCGIASSRRSRVNADAEGELDWEVHYLDATIVRAHQHAAGAKGGTKTRMKP